MAEHQITIPYLPGDAVWLREVDLRGWIVSVRLMAVVDRTVATLYEVAYWWEGRVETVLLRSKQFTPSTGWSDGADARMVEEKERGD